MIMPAATVLASENEHWTVEIHNRVVEAIDELLSFAPPDTYIEIFEVWFIILIEFIDDDVNIFIRLVKPYYSPHTGRFSQEDPICWGHNYYCFAIQNPIMFIDPRGLLPTENSFMCGSFGPQIQSEPPGPYGSWIFWICYGDSYPDNRFNRNQAEIVTQQLTELHGTPTHVYRITSAHEFVDRWNALGSASSIDTAYIIGHGHFTEVGGSGTGVRIGNLLFTGSTFYAQSHTDMGPQDRSINDLNPLCMYYLYFSSCNTANSDFTAYIIRSFFNHNSGISPVSG